MSRLNPPWKKIGNKLTAVFHFKTFLEAVRFVNRVADLAEAANHHPDVLIQYDTVTVKTWTHSTGGVTEKDYALARAIG